MGIHLKPMCSGSQIKCCSELYFRFITTVQRIPYILRNPMSKASELSYFTLSDPNGFFVHFLHLHLSSSTLTAPHCRSPVLILQTTQRLACLRLPFGPHQGQSRWVPHLPYSVPATVFKTPRSSFEIRSLETCIQKLSKNTFPKSFRKWIYFSKHHISTPSPFVSNKTTAAAATTTTTTSSSTSNNNSNSNSTNHYYNHCYYYRDDDVNHDTTNTIDCC